ncbi:hypothetical protein COO60DRAFT_220080 [Scenedesmus sp. NREL 46B-D3]|nr:hypothetical protein COO60DRAFT_220080 [Scenedesmus sp. NREL 46B-D3]
MEVTMQAERLNTQGVVVWFIVWCSNACLCSSSHCISCQDVLSRCTCQPCTLLRVYDLARRPRSLQLACRQQRSSAGCRSCVARVALLECVVVLLCFASSRRLTRVCLGLFKRHRRVCPALWWSCAANSSVAACEPAAAI